MYLGHGGSTWLENTWHCRTFGILMYTQVAPHPVQEKIALRAEGRVVTTFKGHADWKIVFSCENQSACFFKTCENSEGENDSGTLLTRHFFLNIAAFTISNIF